MRRFAAILLASLAASWPAPNAAQHGAKPDINSPFLVNPDVARWKKGFENEDREVYRKRNEILAATGVKPGMTVADVGAGTGLFTMLFAQAVGPRGRVYAVDISRAFIEHIGERDVHRVPTPSCPRPRSTSSTPATLTTISSTRERRCNRSARRSSPAAAWW